MSAEQLLNHSYSFFTFKLYKGVNFKRMFQFLYIFEKFVHLKNKRFGNYRFDTKYLTSFVKSRQVKLELSRIPSINTCSCPIRFYFLDGYKWHTCLLQIIVVNTNYWKHYRIEKHNYWFLQSHGIYQLSRGNCTEYLWELN